MRQNIARIQWANIYFQYCAAIDVLVMFLGSQFLFEDSGVHRDCLAHRVKHYLCGRIGSAIQITLRGSRSLLSQQL